MYDSSINYFMKSLLNKLRVRCKRNNEIEVYEDIKPNTSYVLNIIQLNHPDLYAKKIKDYINEIINEEDLFKVHIILEGGYIFITGKNGILLYNHIINSYHLNSHMLNYVAKLIRVYGISKGDQYKTLKGMLRKGQITSVRNFLINTRNRLSSAFYMFLNDQYDVNSYPYFKVVKKDQYNFDLFIKFQIDEEYNIDIPININGLSPLPSQSLPIPIFLFIKLINNPLIKNNMDITSLTHSNSYEFMTEYICDIAEKMIDKINEILLLIDQYEKIIVIDKDDYSGIIEGFIDTHEKINISISNEEQEPEENEKVKERIFV